MSFRRHNDERSKNRAPIEHRLLTDGGDRGTADGGTTTEGPGQETTTDHTEGVHRPLPEESHTTWTTGEQFGFGTAPPGPETTSRTWFSLTERSLTEPRFPRVDCMQFQRVDFLIVDPAAEEYAVRTHDKPDHETEGGIEHTTEPALSTALMFEQVITERSGDRAWTLTVEYVTDPARDTILFDVDFEATDGHTYDIYMIGEAAIGGYIDGTVGETLDADHGTALGATNQSDKPPQLADADGDGYDTAAALSPAGGFEWATTCSYDGNWPAAVFDRTEQTDPNGRVLVGQLSEACSNLSQTVGLGFSADGTPETALAAVTESLEEGYDTIRAAYVDGWSEYVEAKPVPDAVADDDGLLEQYHIALQVLRAVEDREFVGASVASPSVPWGDNVDATEPRDYGYNFTWSRDLYQVFTALSAVGDVDSACAGLEYLYQHQQHDDGFLPQNTYLDGRTRWGGEQLDNIAYPAVMAYQLANRHDIGFAEAAYDYEDIRRSVEYTLRSGPRTEQERWEEEGGYSPSTIAAIAAGAGCAAEIANSEGKRGDALSYVAHADWLRAAVDDWCATESGTQDHDTTPYFVRITDDGNPEAGHQRSLANNGPELDERAIIDAGFLELVRLGLRSPDEEVIENSIEVVDETIRVDTPNGPCWYRYNGDGYGELGEQEPDEGGPWSMDRNGKGRLWPILTGERGEYELVADHSDGPDPASLLRAMEQFGNTGRMLPEQVWDKPDPTPHGWTFGEGTGAATPLAWTMAQYVRLAHSIDAGEPIETPRVLLERYSTPVPAGPSLSVETVERTGGAVHVTGSTDADELVVWTDKTTTLVNHDGGKFDVTVAVEDGPVSVVGATGGSIPAVGTTLERFEL